MSVALITGITGHVGSYLAEYLLSKGYTVHGVVRRTSNFTTERIDHIFSRLTLHYGDVTDLVSLISIIKNCKPTEIYNLAAQSHVKVSDDIERYTMDTNTLGVLNVLQAIRLVDPNIRMVQASTSEMFGNTIENTKESGKLSETSDMKPVSIYGISKLAGYNLVRYYREAYNMFLCNSIAFNHESPRRGKTFVTRKIAEYVKKWKSGCEPLQLGNLDAKRDWSHTIDIVRGMWLMMQHTVSSDYTLGSGKSHSVRDFIECAFGGHGIEIVWQGIGVNEYGTNKVTGEILIKINEKYFRSVDINDLVCDNTNAKNVLGWKPEITFKDLVDEMSAIHDNSVRHNLSSII